MRLTKLAFLAVLAPVSTSCQPPVACSLVGYENGLSVDIRVSAHDAYRVEVEAEGDVLDLEFQLDENSHANCLGECKAEGQSIYLRDSRVISQFNGFGVNITRLGGYTGPKAATVRVYRDDATDVAVEQTFQPHYRTEEPNGDGCGEHVYASGAIAVP